MKKAKLNKHLQQPPAEIIRGAQIVAEYLKQEVPQFRDNPLIETLPPTLTPEQVTEYLFQLPPFSDKDRQMSQVSRLHMTETAREFFVPNGKHLTVYYAISNLIRRGYVRRNPVLWEYWKRVHDNIEAFLNAIKDKPFPNSRARGFAIVGCGGTGKSTTVEKILQSLPQVITHNSYKGQDLIMKQLVWLKLDCPRNGSLRELCVNFFRAVDEIMITQYETRYAGSSHRTLESLIAGMARVAANHCLGILVIDEIQDLSEARSGGDVAMVNFFVHLENAIGVPFALIGTQAAIPLLSGQFRQTRRVSEQGYVTWDRMSEVEVEIEELFDEDQSDESLATQSTDAGRQVKRNKGTEKKTAPRADLVWKNFVETLWIYQYVKKPISLKKDIVHDSCAHALYKIAKGIPAVVQTVFVLTQQLAILNGEETITPGLIREAVRTNLRIIEDILGEARMKRPQEIRLVSDLSDLDSIYESEDYLEDFTSPSAENLPASQVTPPSDVAARNKVSGSIDEAGPTRNGRTPRSVNKKMSSKRKSMSKDDVPRPVIGRKETTQSKPSSNINKFRRSPNEYLKG